MLQNLLSPQLAPAALPPHLRVLMPGLCRHFVAPPEHRLQRSICSLSPYFLAAAAIVMLGQLALALVRAMVLALVLAVVLAAVLVLALVLPLATVMARGRSGLLGRRTLLHGTPSLRPRRPCGEAFLLIPAELQQRRRTLPPRMHQSAMPSQLRQLLLSHQPPPLLPIAVVTVRTALTHRMLRPTRTAPTGRVTPARSPNPPLQESSSGSAWRSGRSQRIIGLHALAKATATAAVMTHGSSCKLGSCLLPVAA